MEKILEGKAILITGASGGIGWDASLVASESGATVLLTGRDEAKLSALQTEIKNNGGNALIFPFDLSDIENIGGFFKNIVKELNGGLVHGFLHCAASAPLRPLKNSTYKVMKDAFGPNFYAFIEICRYFAEQKFGSVGGSIVGLSSIAASAGESGRLIYAATKGAMESSVRVMAKELAARKIRVNAIRPAMVDTPLSREYIEFAGEDQINGYMQQFQPLGLITPRAVSLMAIYLLSDLSAFVTGSSFPIDAGRLM